MKRINLAVVSALAAAVLILVQVVLVQAQSQTETQAEVATLIQSGDTQQALERIGAGADVNQAQLDGTSPLLWAISLSEPELVQALLAKKADPNAANEFGATPLTEAARISHAGIAKMLLDAGAKVDSANPDGETALMLAIQGGNLPLVEMLVNAGANVNTVEQFHNQTPLMYAAAGGEAEMVKLLLSKDAEVTPRALYTDWPSQVTSEPRTQYRPVGGLTPLLYATRAGCYSCVEQLLAAGADVDRPTPEGITPLMIALDNGHNGVAKLLMEKGANLHVWDWWGRTALWIAVDRKPGAGGGGGGGFGGGGRGGQGGRGGLGGPGGPLPDLSQEDQPEVDSMEIINALLAAGADPNIEMNFHRPNDTTNRRGRFGDNHVSTGTTILFRAVQLNDLESAEALLKAGADPNIVSMGFNSFLLAAGAGPTSRGNRPGGNLELVKLMFDNATEGNLPDVNAQVAGLNNYSYNVSYVATDLGDEGTSGLHGAAESGNLALVRYLLEMGANPNLLDSEGKLPVDLIPVVGPGGPGGPGAAKGGAGAAKGGPAAAKGKGGPGGRGANPADLAEIRSLLQAASAR